MIFVGLASIAWSAEANFSTDHIEFFEAKVRPLLSTHCYECHSSRAKTVEGGLRLDARPLVLAGGDSGAVVVPGKPNESLLIKAVHYQAVEMPPSGKLPDDELAVLEQWIQLGVPWPAETPATTTEASNSKSYDWDKLRNEHWAYRPVQRPALPQVREVHWPQNAIDRFILARLEAAGLKPSPPAEPRILARRIYYDLTGLPPSSEHLEEFLQHSIPNPQSAIRIPQSGYPRQRVISNVVSRLLASPRYGQRWGRHWLDVARYADDLPHAWRYRDWVVDALNTDLPYDQFVRLQIAGDLIAADTGSIATGLFALGPKYNSDGNDPDGIAKAKGETLDDRMDTISRGLLALTVSCARCHDHKFDPIPTLDYYSLAGVFNNTENTDPETGLHALKDSGSADMPVALRGNLRKPGPVAPRRFLRILSGADPPSFTQGSGRRELADAIASPHNPLTARVIVNRVWQHHFGKALVRTPSNFGALGELPTHPLLLDWLAAELVESGWSLKHLHRIIIGSAAYQMSSHRDEKSFQADGDNRLVWRMNLRRLDAESWRDTLLSVTVDLGEHLGGQPTEDILSRRRSLYLKVSRNGDKFATDEFLRLFDFPLMRATVAKRPSSIVPQQYLFLMNSRFMTDRAQRLAQRLEALADNDQDRIHQAYRLLYGRQPSPEEQEIGLAFLEGKSLSSNQQPLDSNQLPQDYAQPDAERKMTPWQQYTQVLLSANELMYVR